MTSGQIDKNKHIKFNKNGETQENSIHQQTRKAQAPVQGPFIQMHTQNLKDRKISLFRIHYSEIEKNI